MTAVWGELMVNRIFTESGELGAWLEYTLSQKTYVPGTRLPVRAVNWTSVGAVEGPGGITESQAGIPDPKAQPIEPVPALRICKICGAGLGPPCWALKTKESGEREIIAVCWAEAARKENKIKRRMTPNDFRIPICPFNSIRAVFFAPPAPSDRREIAGIIHPARLDCQRPFPPDKR